MFQWSEISSRPLSTILFVGVSPLASLVSDHCGEIIIGAGGGGGGGQAEQYEMTPLHRRMTGFHDFLVRGTYIHSVYFLIFLMQNSSKSSK